MSRLILFYGADRYLLESRAQSYIAERIPDSVRAWEVETIDGQTAELDRILVAADALPFLHERRLTLVRQPAFATVKQKGGMSADQKRFLAYLEQADPNNDLVFTVYVEGALSSFLKKCLGLAEAHRCDPLKVSDLMAYASSLAEAQGKVLTRDAVAFLEQHSSALDAATLAAELEKVFLYWAEERQLYAKHLETVIQVSADANVFQMIDAILSGHPREALTTWHRLAEKNENPGMVRYMLADQLRIILAVQAMAEQGLAPKTMAEQLGKHPYVIKKSLPLARRHRERTLVAAYNHLLDAMIDEREGRSFSEEDRFIETVIGTSAAMKVR